MKQSCLKEGPGFDFAQKGGGNFFFRTHRNRGQPSLGKWVPVVSLGKQKQRGQSAGIPISNAAEA